MDGEVAHIGDAPAAEADSPPDAGHEPHADAAPGMIEIGLVIAGSPDEPDLEAISAARERCLDWLGDLFPEFDWRINLVRRNELVTEPVVEPVAVLQHGVQDRNDQEWDFVVVVTAAELASRYESFALAAVSRALDAAVISTSRIDPRAADVSASREDRVGRMAQRLTVLMLHALGHLAGLRHCNESDSVMYKVDSLDDMSGMQRLNAQQRQEMRENLQEIADLRLEERDAQTLRRPLRFFAKSTWINGHEILDAVWQARPWQFPIRLSRLTTAAVSTVLFLMLTAETWDLAMNQPGWRVALLALVALSVTTAYVIQRQRLLVRRDRRRLSEQIVITNVSTVSIVALGMLTTMLGLFAIALTGTLLYPSAVVSAWAASVSSDVGPAHYCLLAGFVAAVALLVGALGASFEEQHHFRHITFVDEEM